MVRSMVKNDNIDVTQRQLLNFDGTCGLLLYFLRVCEDTILSNCAKFFFEFCVVLLSEHEVSRAIVLFDFRSKFSINRKFRVRLHRKRGPGSKNPC